MTRSVSNRASVPPYRAENTFAANDALREQMLSQFEGIMTAFTEQRERMQRQQEQQTQTMASLQKTADKIAAAVAHRESKVHSVKAHLEETYVELPVSPSNSCERAPSDSSATAPATPAVFSSPLSVCKSSVASSSSTRHGSRSSCRSRQWTFIP